jgi:hypothetical protein
MTNITTEIKNAANELRPILNRAQKNPSKGMATILQGRNEVYAYYQPIFSQEYINELTEEQFKSFLLFKNNRHWWSLHRFGGYMTADMKKLREALALLLDENKTIKERFDYLLPNSGAFVPRLGGATLTPILHIAHPNKYGVFNNATTAGLKSLKLLPHFERNMPFSERYAKVNDILLALADEMQIDLWTLDALWWQVVEDQTPSEKLVPEEEIEVTIVDEVVSQSFGLERYLQEFIRDNWDKIKELKDWDLYEEDGNLVGFEYNTGEIGRIDLLARHKTSPKWLVIELKRNQTSDQTVGQVLRYMGWVTRNLADAKDQIEGIIICKSSDASLGYALMNTNNVKLLLYEVDFQLRLGK